MSEQDIRWKQRLQNFSRALKQLEDAVKLSKQRNLNELEKQGLIQAFEFSHELAWNVIKDYFDYQGASQITGSRDATKEAFQKGLIEHGDIWMDMIKSRNLTSHTYNLNIAETIVQQIINNYYICLENFYKKMFGISKK
jgi:nucleotidyltransferase substrate binding protein (TIGR01987 family)